ncbi:ABC transporter permease, partial [Flavihumibacter sp. CACIAM 22H1]|uniref:ABC transporter permease n=1 Tax=Flavihumibacter sp. CACIAM 22H1 TaxID=1812911 RepID=UPI0007A897FE
MIRNYLLITLRNLRRNKVYSLINILGLSFGLAAAILILLYVKDEVSYDRFHTQLQHTYRLYNISKNEETNETRKSGITGYFQGPRFAASVPEIKYFSRYQQRNVDIKKQADIKSQEVFYTDSVFLQMFSFPLLSGNATTALKQKRAAVISEKLAMEQFGTVDALGKDLLIKEEDDKFEPYIVTAVAKNCPQNSTIKFDLLLPIQVTPEDEANQENWFNFFLNTFVVLHPNADKAVVEKKIQAVFDKEATPIMQELSKKYGVKLQTQNGLQPFADIHLSKDLGAENGLSGASNPMYSYILTGIALFILLIACINFVNLTVARSVKRAKEIGIRKVVGGNRGQLIVQFLGESVLLCFLSFLLALVLSQSLLGFFNQVANKALSLTYLLDLKLVAGFIGLFLLTAFLAGFYPAMVLSGYDPVKTLYNRFNLAGKNYLQKSLVVIQFALASFLIIATLTIYSQFNYLTTVETGVDETNLVLVNNWRMSHSKAALLRNQLKQHPSIVDVAFKNGGSWGTRAKVNGEQQIQFAYESVGVNYLPLLHIQLKAGRNFSADLPTDSTRSVLVNETFAKEAGWTDPLGKEVDFWYNEKKYTVIGVVKDYHYEALQQKIGPQLFTMNPENQYGLSLIKIAPGSATAALAHIEKAFKAVFPYDPYSYQFMDEANLHNYEAENRWKQIMLFSAVITIFISCIGLFGLAVLSTEKRTKEIGIRKVLGASVQQVATILSRDFLLLVVISLLISLPLAWLAASKWLENYPYRIQPGWELFSLGAA